jgi:hypothetical protein
LIRLINTLRGSDPVHYGSKTTAALPKPSKAKSRFSLNTPALDGSPLRRYSSRQKKSCVNFLDSVTEIFRRRRTHMFSAQSIRLISQALLTLGLVVGGLVVSTVGFAQRQRTGKEKSRLNGSATNSTV